MWKKRGGTQFLDQEKRTLLQNSQQRELLVHVLSPYRLRSTVCVAGRCLEWAPGVLLTQWVCMKAEEAKLMKLYSYKGVQTICTTFASKTERDYIYYTGQQTEVSSVPEADTEVNCE